MADALRRMSHETFRRVSMRHRCNIPGPPVPETRSADPSQSRPAIWTVSVTRLARLFSEVSPEFDAQASIQSINLGFEEALEAIHLKLQHERCDAVIAAGSNGAYLKSRLPVPVVLVRPTGFELMAALARAKRMARRVAVVTYQHEYEAFNAFASSFGLEIEQRSFVTSEDARDAVSELAAAGVGAIVGTGMVADYADAAGLRGVLLYSAASARAAFETALDISSAGRTLGRRLAGRPAEVHGRARPPGRQPLLVGESAAIKAVRAQINQYAATHACVLITGETGTGKELVARGLHLASARAQRPLVAVNCGALAESLFEAELFGYEEGAFTGARRGGRVGLIESAHGGTLFLDEIGDLPLAMQSRLLRVLEGREVLRVGANRPVEVDVRVVAATHRDLAAMVEAGEFRADLYFRLNVLRVSLPPLRDRLGDVAPLAAHLLSQLAAGAAPRLGGGALKLLQAYRWPGNVRELRNVLERGFHLSSAVGAPLDADCLRNCAPELVAAGASLSAVVATPGGAGGAQSGPPSLEELRALLQQTRGHRGRAAAALGVSRSTLWRWMQQAGVS